jgi:hypothetical protein
MSDPAYIVDLYTGERLEFQFAPNDLREEKSGAWASSRVPGQSHPRYQFTAGGARTLQFTLDLYRLDDLEQRVRWLQSLEYPEYEQQILSAPPHLVAFLFGTLYEDVAWMVTSVKNRYFELFTPGLKPLRAEVDIQLEEYIDRAVDYREIRR